MSRLGLGDIECLRHLLNNFESDINVAIEFLQ